MSYQRRYAYSHLHTPAGTDTDPIVVTGPLQCPSLQSAMDAAEHGQPAERSTRWDEELTNKAGELADWSFGSVVAPGHEVTVCAHPAEVDAIVILAAWRLAKTQRPVGAPTRKPTPLPRTIRQCVEDLQYERAPRYATDAQWAAYSRIHARSGATPITREKLDAAAERTWRKAPELAKRARP